MNYSDYIDYQDSEILKAWGFAKEFDFMGKIFLSNPYPAQRKEVLKIRLKSYSNISITNIANNEILVPDTDYHSTFILKFKSIGLRGNMTSNIQHKNRWFNGLILGKTYKITFNTPECLEQCESCTEKGIEEHKREYIFEFI